jgi:hypothetical protein
MYTTPPTTTITKSTQRHICPHYSIDTMMNLRCATIGVPCDIAYPYLLDDNERSLFDTVYTVGLPFPVECADDVAIQVRHSKTNTVYNTHGGISSDEELLDKRIEWTISNKYKITLKKIAKRFRVALTDVILCDQSFRTKRYFFNSIAIE